MVPKFIRTLVPRREQRMQGRPLLVVLRELTWLQWAMFFSGWLAWTTDAMDFFAVSLSVNMLKDQFNKSVHAITTAITLTLLFRSIGALIFGALSDRYGRKWPLVCNLLLVAVLELGAGFANDFKTFLALRSLFGIGMGGIWGMASSTALENLPVEARGLASGILQEGYAVGYLFAACINLKLVPATAVKWRSLFFTAAGVSVFAAAIRALLPDSELFLKAQAIEDARGTTTMQKTKIFFRETANMLKMHWKRFIYVCLLMTGMNFLAHGSQDLYPTYLQTSKGFTAANASIATIIGNCGAVAGGIIAGVFSQYIGRRLMILICILWVAVFIPLWILPEGFGALSAGAFFIQVGVQGAWGVIPIWLSEMSPPAFRAMFTGVAYQIGNAISAASAQIEATGGDNLKTTLVQKGKTTIVADYATVQGIFIGCICAFVFFTALFGPENHAAHFENHKTAFEEGAARDDAVFDDEPTGSEPGSKESMEKEKEKV